MPDERDGFVIRDHDGNEVHFIACDRGGSARERTEMGILMKTRDDLIVEDTRWGCSEKVRDSGVESARS